MGIRMVPSFFRPNRGSKASDAGTKGIDPQPAKPGSQPVLPPLDPSKLNRIKGRTVMLPSQTPERTEVKPARPPISRPQPDTKPPVTFMGSTPPESTFVKQPRKFLNVPIPFTQKISKRTWDACAEKWEAMPTGDSRMLSHPEDILKNKEYMDMLKDEHPNFRNYSLQGIEDNAYDVLKKHPKFQAELARSRNELYSIPSAPTGSRIMKPGEQRFLTAAFKRMGEEFGKHPMRIHGETAITGNKQGGISEPTYNPRGNVTFIPRQGDNYNVHTHPPFHEPLTSSASEPDHKVAAEAYVRENKMGTYVSNGKDVLHISPTSTELTKLIPDPKLEKKLGKFPTAFELPTPQQPPYPLANHEAPPTFRGNWEPPAGWKPPRDGQRD